jgi:hypothetical protein
VTDEHPPGPLTSLDDELRRVRFEPRASLGAELAGRARRGEQPVGAVHPWQSFRVRSAMALVGVAAAAALVVGATPLPRNIDLCCQDFDGGRDENDGIVLSLDPDGRVTELLLYEDLDGSHSRSAGDAVRFARGAELLMDASGPQETLNTFVRCCQDLDGGGVADDGVVVMGRFPDEVRFAALVEYHGEHKVLR